MRIPIREQLGALVMLASLIGLAVISIATWVSGAPFSSAATVLFSVRLHAGTWLTFDAAGYEPQFRPIDPVCSHFPTEVVRE